MRVGIIGGGVGGLAAAHDLLKSGHQVALYERAPFLGGLASTFNVGGGRLERFYHHLFTSDTTIIALLHELGLGDRLIWEHSKVGWFTNGRIYPFSTPMDLLWRFKPVSLPNRIRMGLVTVYLQRLKNWKKLEGTTASAFMRKWSGKRNYEVFWEPLLNGKFSIYKEQVAMPWLWAKFATRTTSRDKLGKEKLAYIRGSWGVLIDELERRIKAMGGEVHAGATVTRITTAEGRVTGLAVQDADGQKSERPFDVVLSTVPTFLLPRLVDLPEEYAAKCKAVDYEGAIAVVWVLKHPFTHIYWLNIGTADIPFLLVLEQTNLVPASEYGGKHIIYTANYVPASDYRWPMSPQEIVKSYIPHLKKINSDFDESWVEETFVHKESAAQPIMTTHYSQKIPPVKTPIEGLWTAAMSQVYPMDRGTNYSIQLGVEVARRAVAETKPAPASVSPKTS